MKSLLNATDPDLERFLVRRNGKLMLWHGWNDAGAPPEPTKDYYDAVVAATFGGDVAKAREHARLFMFPGMGHCAGGPGPNTWDPLEPLVAWVETGTAPDFVVATHSTDGRVDNERRVCAYPQVARYSGPADGANDRANWTASQLHLPLAAVAGSFRRSSEPSQAKSSRRSTVKKKAKRKKKARSSGRAGK